MIAPNLEEYRPFTDGFDMTDEQKDELILTVWTILSRFVDESFGLRPIASSKNENNNSHLTQ